MAMDTRSDGPSSSAIILHEVGNRKTKRKKKSRRLRFGATQDKKYYRTSAELHGDDVETMIQEEDTQHLSEPIVKQVKVSKFANVEQVFFPFLYLFSPSIL